jgi:hypothetical protein
VRLVAAESADLSEARSDASAMIAASSIDVASRQRKSVSRAF